jgi:hypothetical protein
MVRELLGGTFGLLGTLIYWEGIFWWQGLLQGLVWGHSELLRGTFRGELLGKGTWGHSDKGTWGNARVRGGTWGHSDKGTWGERKRTSGGTLQHPIHRLRLGTLGTLICWNRLGMESAGDTQTNRLTGDTGEGHWVHRLGTLGTLT